MTPVRRSDFAAKASAGARAEVVNRTHRVVREEARRLREQRSRSRSLWVPLGICSGFLAASFWAAWYTTAGYDLAPTGIPDASDQILLFLLWSLPITAIVVAVLWFRRHRAQSDPAEGSAR